MLDPFSLELNFHLITGGNECISRRILAHLVIQMSTECKFQNFAMNIYTLQNRLHEVQINSIAISLHRPLNPQNVFHFAFQTKPFSKMINFVITTFWQLLNPALSGKNTFFKKDYNLQQMTSLLKLIYISKLTKNE